MRCVPAGAPAGCPASSTDRPDIGDTRSTTQHTLWIKSLPVTRPFSGRESCPARPTALPRLLFVDDPLLFVLPLKGLQRGRGLMRTRGFRQAAYAPAATAGRVFADELARLGRHLGARGRFGLRGDSMSPSCAARGDA